MKQDKKIKRPVAAKGGRQSAEGPGLQKEEKPGVQKDKKMETCRCKEVAEKTKTPIELVKTMLDDLAVWKKKERKKSF
ncbi:MAG: hypothetical protein M0Z61_17785 [Nitrospiraceae bacterium]|nr:hypothetical protein [Nitrospiraceae bacterium]